MGKLYKSAAAKAGLIALMAVSAVLALQTRAMAVVGDGTADVVTGDKIGDTKTLVTDYGIENITVVLTIFATLFAFSLGIILLIVALRRVVTRLRQLVGAA